MKDSVGITSRVGLSLFKVEEKIKGLPSLSAAKPHIEKNSPDMEQVKKKTQVKFFTLLFPSRSYSGEKSTHYHLPLLPSHYKKKPKYS